MCFLFVRYQILAKSAPHDATRHTLFFATQEHSYTVQFQYLLHLIGNPEIIFWCTSNAHFWENYGILAGFLLDKTNLLWNPEINLGVACTPSN